MSRQTSLQEVCQPQAIQSDFQRSNSLQEHLHKEHLHKERLAREERAARHRDLRQQSLVAAAAARNHELARQEELTLQDLARHDMALQGRALPRDLPPARQHFSRDLVREQERSREYTRDMQEFRLRQQQDTPFGRTVAAAAGAVNQAAHSPHQNLARQQQGGPDLQELLRHQGGPGPKLDYGRSSETAKAHRG
eukprot:TRINITY_DN90_c1_g1_i1.p1 TRINITY_DN90_c1_g1~~TRINITY_DN90_c1_g1_i1.p1  ORF type:complete len:224 (-),score=45.72 TRINITY_DN90_c1_g1_i1:2-583(-)